MKLPSTLNKGEKFHQLVPMITTVLIGLLIVASGTVHSEARKARQSENAANGTKDPVKIVESMAKYSKDALNLTLKSLGVMNATDGLLREAGEGVKNEQLVKDYERAKANAPALIEMAKKGSRETNEALIRIKRANSSKEIEEALMDAVKGAEESKEALKGAKRISIHALAVIKHISGKKKHGPREEGSVKREEEITSRALFDIDAIMKQVEGHVKNAITHVQTIAGMLLG